MVCVKQETRNSKACTATGSFSAYVMCFSKEVSLEFRSRPALCLLTLDYAVFQKHSRVCNLLFVDSTCSEGLQVAQLGAVLLVFGVLGADRVWSPD